MTLLKLEFGTDQYWRKEQFGPVWKTLIIKYGIRLFFLIKFDVVSWFLRKAAIHELFNTDK